MTSDIFIEPEQRDLADDWMLGFKMQVAARFMQRLGSERCQNAAVKPPFLDVLFMIERHPGIRQGQCAERLGFDATTFGRYVDRLARNDLVKRDIPKNDRRSVTLSLTSHGERALAECQPMLNGLESESRERMGEDNWAKLMELLDQFLGAYDHPLTRLDSGSLDKG